MKKFGFTLAEVLITLSIIGVVAALTLPALSTNAQQAQVGPSVLKAMNTLQNSISLAMQQNNIRNMANYTTVVSVFNGLLINTLDTYGQESIKKDSCSSKTFPAYKKYDLADFDTIKAGSVVFGTKDGIEFIIPNSSDTTEQLEGTKYSKIAFPVYIDTNGFCKSPNRLGRDVFLLYVDLQGIVFPYGGYEYARYVGDDSPKWKTDCNSTGVTDAAACTGYVVDNNAKATYLWK